MISDCESKASLHEQLHRLALVTALSMTAVGMAAYLVPLFALSLGASALQVGLVGSGQWGGSAISAVPAGLIIDRYGVRRAVRYSCLIVGILAPFVALTKSLAVLMALLFFLSFAWSFSFVGVATLFLRPGVVPDYAGGWYKGLTAVGVSFTGPFLAWLALSQWDYFSAFLVEGALLAACALLVPRFGTFPEWDLASGGSGGIDLRQIKLLLSDRVLRGAAALGGLGAAALATFLTFASVLVVRELKLDVILVAQLFAVQGFTYIGLSLLGGFALEIFRGRTATALAVVFTVLSLWLFSFGETSELINAAALLLGLGLGIIDLVAITWLRTSQTDTGKVAGMYELVVGAGFVAGPTFAGLIGNLFGNRAVFLAIVPTQLIIFLFIARRQSLGNQTHHAITD